MTDKIQSLFENADSSIKSPVVDNENENKNENENENENEWTTTDFTKKSPKKSVIQNEDDPWERRPKLVERNLIGPRKKLPVKEVKKWDLKNFVKKPKLGIENEIGRKYPPKKYSPVKKRKKWDLDNFVEKSNLKRPMEAQVGKKAQRNHLPKKPSTVKKRNKWDLKNFLQKSSRRFHEMSASRIRHARVTVAEPVVVLKSRDIITKRRLLRTTGLTWQQWKEYYSRSKTEKQQSLSLNSKSTSEGKAQFLDTPSNHEPVNAPEPSTCRKILPPDSFFTYSKNETEEGATSRLRQDGQIKSERPLSLPSDSPEGKKFKRKRNSYFSQPPVKKVKKGQTHDLIVSLFGSDSESECTANDSLPSTSTDTIRLDSNPSGGQSANCCQREELHHSTSLVNNSINQRTMGFPKQAGTSIETKKSTSIKRDDHKKPRPLSMDSVNIPASHERVTHQSRSFDKSSPSQASQPKAKVCSTPSQRSDEKCENNTNHNGNGTLTFFKDHLPLKKSLSSVDRQKLEKHVEKEKNLNQCRKEVAPPINSSQLHSTLENEASKDSLIESAHGDKEKERSLDNEIVGGSTSQTALQIRSDAQCASAPFCRDNDPQTRHIGSLAKKSSSVRLFNSDNDKNNNDELRVSKDVFVTSRSNHSLIDSLGTVINEEKQNNSGGKSSAEVTVTASPTDVNSVKENANEIHAPNKRSLSVVESDSDDNNDKVSEVRQNILRDAEDSTYPKFQIKVRNPDEINRSFESSTSGHLLQNVTDEFIIKFYEDNYEPWSKEESKYSLYGDYIANIRKNSNIVFNSQTVSRADRLKMLYQIQNHALICRHLTRVFNAVQNHEHFSLYVLIHFLHVCASVPVACRKAQLKLCQLGKDPSAFCIRASFLRSLRSKQMSPNSTVEKLKRIVGDVSFWESCNRILRLLFHKSNANSVHESLVDDSTESLNLVSAEETSPVNRTVIESVQVPPLVGSNSHDENNISDSRAIRSPCQHLSVLGSEVNRDNILQHGHLRKILSGTTPSTTASASMVQNKSVPRKLNTYPQLAFVTASPVSTSDENAIALNRLTVNQNGLVVQTYLSEHLSPRNPPSTLSTSLLQQTEELNSHLSTSVISVGENYIGNLTLGNPLESANLPLISPLTAARSRRRGSQINRSDFSSATEVGSNISFTYTNQQQVLRQETRQPAVGARTTSNSALASTDLCFQQSSVIATAFSQTYLSSENTEMCNRQVQADVLSRLCEVDQNSSLNGNYNYVDRPSQNSSAPQQLFNNNLCPSAGASPEFAIPFGMVPNLIHQSMNRTSQRDVLRPSDLQNSSQYYCVQQNTVIQSHQRVQHQQQSIQPSRQEMQQQQHVVQTNFPQQESLDQRQYLSRYERQLQPGNQPPSTRNFTDPSSVRRAVQESASMMTSNSGYPIPGVAQTSLIANHPPLSQNYVVENSPKSLVRTNRPMRKVQAASSSSTLESLLLGETYRAGPSRRFSSEAEITVEPSTPQHAHSNRRRSPVSSIHNFSLNARNGNAYPSVRSRSSSANVEENITNLHVDKVFTATDAEGNSISFHVKTPTIPGSNSAKSASTTSKCPSEAYASTNDFTRESTLSKVAGNNVVSSVLSESVPVNSNAPPKILKKPRVKYTKCRSGVHNHTSIERKSRAENPAPEVHPVVESHNKDNDDSSSDLQIDLDAGENGKDTNSVPPSLNRPAGKSSEASYAIDSSSSSASSVDNPEILEILEQIPHDNFNKDLVLDIVKKKLGSADGTNEHSVRDSSITVTAPKATGKGLEDTTSIITMAVSQSEELQVANPSNAASDMSELVTNPLQPQDTFTSGGDSIQSDKLCQGTSSKGTNSKVARHNLPASIAKPASVFRNHESRSLNSIRKSITKSSGNSKTVNDASSSSSLSPPKHSKQVQQYTILNDPENICKLVFTAKSSTPKSKSSSGELRRETCTSNISGNNTDVNPVVWASIDTHLRETPSAEIGEALMEIYLDREECTESDRTLSREVLRDKTMEYFRQRSKSEICQLLNTRLNAAQRRKSEVEDPRKRKSIEVEVDAAKKAFMRGVEPDNQLNGSQSSSTTSSQLTPPPTPTDECSRRCCNKAIMDEKYPCDGCNKVVYCSESCKTQDFFENHCNECDRNVF